LFLFFYFVSFPCEGRVVELAVANWFGCTRKSWRAIPEILEGSFSFCRAVRLIDREMVGLISSLGFECGAKKSYRRCMFSIFGGLLRIGELLASRYFLFLFFFLFRDLGYSCKISIFPFSSPSLFLTSNAC